MSVTERRVLDDVRAERWGELIELSASEVFRMMLNSELARIEHAPQRTAEITAVIGVAGKICGVFSIRCSGRAAALMTAAMLGLPSEEVTKQTWDGVGEICNMVAGNFKTKLNEMGDQCLLSVPTVVSGADYELRSLVNGERLERSFLFQDEPVTVTFDLER